MIRVNTFGVRAMQRLGLGDRRHRGFARVERLTPHEIYNAIRGCTIATRQAYDEANPDDLAASLHRTQVLAAELLRRCPGLAGLTALTADEDAVALTAPPGSAGPGRRKGNRQGAKSAKRKSGRAKKAAKRRTRRTRGKRG